LIVFNFSKMATDRAVWRQMLIETNRHWDGRDWWWWWWWWCLRLSQTHLL